MVHLLPRKNAEGYCDSFVLIVGSTDNLEDSYNCLSSSHNVPKSTKQKITKYRSELNKII